MPTSPTVPAPGTDALLSRRAALATLAGASAMLLGLAGCGAATPTTASTSAGTSGSAITVASPATSAAAPTLATTTAVASSAVTSSVAAVQPSGVATKLYWIAKLKSIPQAQIDTFVQVFTAAHPGLSIELTIEQQTAAGLAKLKTFAASGQPLDVVSTLAGVPDLRELHGAYPLDALMAQDRFDTSQFAPNAYKGVEVNGKTLALPHAYAGNELVLVANRGLFQKAGVPLPAADWQASWSWQEFRDTLKKLTNLSGTTPVVGTSRFGTIYDVPPMWGAQWASDDAKTITCDSPAMIEAFTNYYDFILKDHTASFSPGAPKFHGEPFESAQSATFTICCAVPTTTKILDQKNLDYAFLPFPKATKAVPDMGGTDIAIWAQSKHPDLAWQLLRWCVEEGRLANLEERMPSQKSAIAPYVATYYGKTPAVRPEVFSVTPDYIPAPDPLFQTPASNQADATITKALADVQAGKITVQSALTALKPQLQALLDQYKND